MTENFIPLVHNALWGDVIVIHRLEDILGEINR